MGHTEGIWKRNTDAGKTTFVVGDKREVIFEVIHHENTVSEREANDRLIAAAPELLEAVSEFLNAHKENRSLMKAYRMCQQAINKATQEYTEFNQLPGYNANKFVSEPHVFIQGVGTFFETEEIAVKNAEKSNRSGNFINMKTSSRNYHGIEIWSAAYTQVWD